MSTIKKNQPAPKKNIPVKDHQFGFVFNRTNYMLMLVGIGVIAIGFILMVGGKSEDPKVFSEAIFDTQRLVISPILLVIGFIIEILAIMYRPKKDNTINKETESK